MKKITFLLICSLFLFSCEYSTKNPEKVEENKKIETNSGKVEEKILTEKEVLEICPYNNSLSFYFLVDNNCYSLWVESELNWPYANFFLYSKKDTKKVEIDWKIIEEYINLFDTKEVKEELEKWYKKHDNYTNPMIPDTFIYLDIFKHYSKILKELWIKNLPEKAYLSKEQDLNYNENFQEVVKKEKDYLYENAKIKIDLTKIENLKLEKLYEEIRKEFKKES